MSRASDSVLVTEVHKNFRIAVYTGAYKFAYYYYYYYYFKVFIYSFKYLQQDS